MAEAPKIATPAQRKRLAVFLDGTWNVVGDNTNVWRLKSLCAPSDSKGIEQISYYEKGVSGFLGGLFGDGLDENISSAYQWLINHYEPEDEIFIFGFSRGAYTARSLAGFIAKCGLLKSGAPLGVKQLYNRYRRANERTIWALLEAQQNGTLGAATLEEQWMLKYSMAIHIKLVGVWDTVGELGIPFFSVPGLSRSTFGFLTTGLRQSIDFGFHALAVDEHRRDFSPTLWTVKTLNVQHNPNLMPDLTGKWRFVAAF